MKKLILIFGLLICVSPSWASITCKQGGLGCTTATQLICRIASGTSCNITVPATTAHAVGAICAAMDGNLTLTSASDGGYTQATASHSNDATLGGSVYCLYNLNETGGATTITCTFSSSSGAKDCNFWEFTYTGASVTFDVANVQDDTANCTSCAGTALTTTTSNNYILVQVAYCGGACSAINQSYNFNTSTDGDGFAWKINSGGSGTTPNWTQSPTGRLLGGAIAIYETASAGVVRHRAMVVNR